MMNLWKKLNENPVYIREKILFEREKKRKKFVSPIVLHLTFLILPVLTCYFYGIFQQGVRIENLRTIFAFSMAISILFYPMLALGSSALFAREKEKRTYDNLISTALSPGEIVMGKFWFSFSPALKEMTIYFPIYVVIGFLLKMSLLSLVSIYIFALIFVGLNSFVGLYFSVKTNTTREASDKCLGIVVSGVSLLSIMSIFFIFMYLSEGHNIAFTHEALLKSLSDSYNIDFARKALIKTLVEIFLIINPVFVSIELFSWAGSSSNDSFFASLLDMHNTLPLLTAAALIYLYSALLLYKKIVSIVSEVPGGGKLQPVKANTGEPATGEKTSQEFESKSESLNLIRLFLAAPEFFLIPRLVIPIVTNPVFYKDMQIFGRRLMKLPDNAKKAGWKDLISRYAIYIPVILIILPIIFGEKEAAHYLFLLLSLIAFSNFHFSNMGSGELIKQEKTAGTWDMLKSSLLTPEDIFWGKFWIIFYHPVRRLIFWFPVYLVVGILCKVTILGMFLFLIATIVTGVLSVVRGLYGALQEGRKIPLKQKIFGFMEFPLTVLSFFGSALLVEMICQNFSLIPFTERVFFLHIYPVTDLFFNISKGIFDGFTPLLLLSGLAFITIFLAILIPMTEYFYRKSLEILREV